ncbi:hypothetical protein TNCV_176171 [Trichonephila clavipes]|nr:hypothetical protein TNCV_176171 [Trichonephila clavipes]
MNVLRTMVQHVKRKRPLPRNGFLLHHDNARPPIARCVMDVSQLCSFFPIPAAEVWILLVILSLAVSSFVTG